MGMPVKLSDELVLAARMEAQATERTITSQIEHWAKLGRAAEAALSYGEVVKLKLAGFDAEAPVAKAKTSRSEMRKRLESVSHSRARENVLDALRAAGRPVYEATPDHPGYVTRIEADGKRMVGRFEGRRFVHQHPPGKEQQIACGCALSSPAKKVASR